jgi:phosphoribosylanthranilate isomerase
MTQVKICGINDAAGFDAAVEAGADWLGFVFFASSPRSVTPETAASLSVRHPGGPLRVGLFVEPTVAAIGTVLAGVRLDALQIYGAVDALPAIKAAFGLPIWRAIGISGPFDLPPTLYPADRLVLEAKAPAGASRPGGNAMTFDWSVLSDWTVPGPWMLAGGLTPETVVAAIRQTGAPAVDVSSGVERSKGVKDPALIHAFVAAAKGAGN